MRYILLVLFLSGCYTNSPPSLYYNQPAPIYLPQSHQQGVIILQPPPPRQTFAPVQLDFRSAK